MYFQKNSEIMQYLHLIYMRKLLITYIINSIIFKVYKLYIINTMKTFSKNDAIYIGKYAGDQGFPLPNPASIH